jgi:multidrug efflux pump subunit AcrA (membrane-fusion protein)/Zn-dependent protease with chaperone function
VTGAIIGPFFGAITNHLWQSTIFALAAALLTLAFRDSRAQVRYWLWLSASLKFLIPLALLMSLGNNFWDALAASRIAPEFVAPVVSRTMVQIAQPFPAVSFSPAAPHTTNWLPIAIFAVWACGFGAIVLMRLRGWLRVRAAVRAGTPIDIGASVEVRSSPGLLEPGVVGFLRSTLLLPQGILQTLTPPQLEAILAHELSHIRRRDNLTAALHMLVEAVFWFYPPIWWIGARLVNERERACDEAVLSLGNEPGDYAEAILNVCRLYVESPLTCVSGVTGPSLNRRIRAILTQPLAGELRYRKKMALVITGLAVLGAPIVLGMMIAPLARAQSSSFAADGVSAQRGTSPTLQVGTQSKSRSATGAKPHRPPAYLNSLGVVSANTVTVTPRLDGQLISVSFKEGELVQKGQLLAKIDGHPYQPQLVEAQSQLARDQAQLDAAAATQGSTPAQQRDEIAQLKAILQTDQAKVEIARRQLLYADVTAPITGVVGFRLVDAGNFVHSGEGLVVINQLQPIAVLFNIQEDYLPEVLARLRTGANPSVVLWNRTFTKRIVVGRLVAVDNQIDTTTGTVKLKATFENKNGALFPGEFVNVRLLLKTR